MTIIIVQNPEKQFQRALRQPFKKKRELIPKIIHDNALPIVYVDTLSLTTTRRRLCRPPTRPSGGRRRCSTRGRSPPARRCSCSQGSADGPKARHPGSSEGSTGCGT